MKETLIYVLAQVTYNLFLRDIIKRAIEDPTQDWDDETMRALDAVMGYKK